MYQMVEDKIFGMGFIGLEPGRLYKIGQSPKLKDQTASGNPLLLNSAEAPFTALTLYGHSTQDGTPSPDNPVPIVSAGDSGEIGVTVQGGNLLDSSEMEIGGLSGSSGKDFDATNRIRTGFIAVTSGEIYTLSGYSPYNIANSHVFQSDKETRIDSFRPGVAVPENGAWVRISFSKADQGDFTEEELEALKNTLVFNIGSTALPYEPYKQLQTLTVSAPGGLPGIPVTSGGNYTDESGQQWICDEVDFSRGKYVKRVNMKTFDGSKDEFWSTYVTSGYEGFAINILDMLVTESGPGLSNLFPIGGVAGQPRIRLGANNNRMYMNNTNPDIATTVDEWLSWLSNNPLRVLYVLETPIETDLSDEEMAAYKALHTYSPTTTVSNDAGAWMKVGYKTNEL